MNTRPNDPLFNQQWHLKNDGQGRRRKGIDLNVLKVWPDYTGKGITVGVLDTGVERDHEDLQANYDSNPAQLPGYSYQQDGRDVQEEGHGTSIAGIIAASRNDIGTTGIAYDAKVTGFNQESAVLDRELRQQQAFDISNNSWGNDVPFLSNLKNDDIKAELQGIETATRQGREGLGTVFVFGAGNSFEAGASSNYEAHTVSRFTIPVGAVGGDGIISTYSVQGSNLLVSAPSDDGRDRNSAGGIVATDLTGNQGYNPSQEGLVELDNRNYTQTFGGTSAASPMVAGVVALMLEANPTLGYRDVQEILAYSSRQVDRNNKAPNRDGNWAFNGAKNWNGGGLHHSLDYGYGLVDAHAAVRLAETWTTQHTLTNEQQVTATSSSPTAIEDNATATSTLNVNSALTIDHAVVDVNLSHQSIEDLVVTLVSPDGTRSRLFNGPALATVSIDDNQEPVSFTEFANNPRSFTSERDLIEVGESYRQGINAQFSTTFNWGETGVGDWTLEVQDTKTGTTGTLNNWSLSLYGDRPSDDNTYFYSNEFARTVRQDPSSDRTVLSDDQGTDTLNAAMVTKNLSLNLKPGATNKIGRRSLTIDAGTVIEHAFGGDGRDRIRGNSADNRLDGGRGNDKLVGRNGADTLLGNAGTDRLRGGKDNDQLLGGDGNDRLLGGSGDDLLDGGTGINRLVGQQGDDIFVLNSGDGYSVIQDFEDGGDRIGLSQGLDFNSLGFSQTDKGVEILLGSDRLALVNGIQTTDLTQADFTTV
ncbi:MAG: S8 family serine peptidase [Cyanobacteria bacterium P01_F01_bin.150]